MKKGSWLVNTARGAICDAEAVKEAVESGHLLGYGGDVWNESISIWKGEANYFAHVQPAPKDHPWRQMRNPNGLSSWWPYSES